VIDIGVSAGDASGASGNFRETVRDMRVKSSAPITRYVQIPGALGARGFEVWKCPG
jgi:hypothetical protein